MMNSSLLPEKKIEFSSKSLGLQSINSQKLINYKLFHVDKLSKRKELSKKYNSERDKDLLSYYQNKGLLSAIPKLHSKQKNLIKIKTSLKDSNSYLTSPQKNQKTDVKPHRRRQKLFTLSNKRFSTSCTNNEESPQSIDRNQGNLLDQLKRTNILESEKVGIRVVRRKRKVTISEFLEEKNRKVRDYECSKLCRTDIIPHYLIFSEKSSKSQEKKLIKNISERIYPAYKICPNFDALQR